MEGNLKYELRRVLDNIKIMIHKWKKNQLSTALSKFKIFMLLNLPLRKWKQKPDREKTFANHIPHKGLGSRTHKELSQHRNKINNPILKGPKDFNRYFTKKDMWMANKHMKNITNH